MGFFSNYYTRPGPGIPKDLPPKKGLALFFDIFFREFFELIKLNLLFLLFCLPIVTIPAALTAASKITVTMVQDRNHFLWSDFFNTFKQEFGRSLIVGTLLAFGMLVSGFCIQFYIAALPKSVFFYLPLSLSLLIAMLLSMMGYYVFVMLASIKQSLKHILRNAFLLTMVYLPYNLLVFGIHAVLYLLVFLYFPLSTPFVLLFLFAHLQLISTFCAWHALKKYVIRGPVEKQS